MKSIYNNLLFKIIDDAFSVMFLKDTLFQKKVKSIPKTPDNFNPVIRFAVCSDVHVSGEEVDKGAENFASLIDDMNALSENGHIGIDALMVAGDMTNRGLDKQYERFVSVLDGHRKEETKLLICIGNHEFIEYRDYAPKIGYEKYKKHISDEMDTHNIVNGYHFIGVSYSDDAWTFKGKENWLEEEIVKAEKAEPNKPVFVFQHPAPTATIYGSIVWGDKLIKKVLKKHKNVIDFSGHSHYVPSDPRTCYQGKFTAFGTGSLEGLLGNPGYVQSDSHSPLESAGCLVVEADADSNVRVRCYDVISHSFFKDGERYLPNITKNGLVYSWGNMKKMDTKPQFKSDEISVIKNEDNTVSISFDSARGFYPAEGYSVVVKDIAGKTVFDKTVVSEYTRADSNKMLVNLGEVQSGTYRVKVTPRSPFAKIGKKINKTINF